MLFARQILYKNFFYFPRFGIRDSPVATDEDAKKKARLAKFASVSKTDPLEEEKRKARTIRVSLQQESSLVPKISLTFGARLGRT